MCLKYSVLLINTSNEIVCRFFSHLRPHKVFALQDTRNLSLAIGNRGNNDWIRITNS